MGAEIKAPRRAGVKPPHQDGQDIVSRDASVLVKRTDTIKLRKWANDRLHRYFWPERRAAARLRQGVLSMMKRLRFIAARFRLFTALAFCDDTF